ncbi:MAG: MHYT domain-containing protein, partial [Mariprofundaceae bacterium]|nr:MHYT domain-containing protein [Mariprofundaceae bacterium]
MELGGSYHAGLVVLSVAIAIVSSFVALTVVPRIHDDTAGSRRAGMWVLVFGVSMGVGIWSMHFIAMLAFRLPVPVRYDVP